MKKIHLIPALFLGLFLSCKDSSQTVSPAVSPTIDYDAQIKEEIKNHVSINAPVIEQNKVRNIGVNRIIEGRATSYSFQYDYYSDGKIKSVGLDNQNPLEYTYKDGTLVDNYSKKSYLLDNAGLVQGFKDDSQTKFFYKDGFLLRTNIANDPKYTYSQTGNLLTASFPGNNVLNYEYTDYPNTVRQEILKMLEYSNSVRDLYLGRYSTNLIKIIKNNNTTLMTFEYEFDNQKRVTKITMNRTTTPVGTFGAAPAIIEYNLSY